MNRKSKPSASSGVVLIEALLVMPIIIFIALAGVEFTRSLRTMKIAITLSREVANVAFRDCAQGLLIANSLGRTPGSCLADVRQEVQDMASGVVANSEVIATIFLAGNAAAVPPVAPVRVSDGGREDAGYRFQSQVPANALTNFPAAFPSLNNLDDHQIVVIGEAYVPYNPLLHFVSNQLGLVYIPTAKLPGGADINKRANEGMFYDATIL